MRDYTWASVYWMYLLMAIFAVGAVFFLVKGIRSGIVSFDEAPKFRMLDDDDGSLVATHEGNAEQLERRQQ